MLPSWLGMSFIFPDVLHSFVQGWEPGQDQGQGASQPPPQDPQPPQPGPEAFLLDIELPGVPGLPAAPILSDDDAGLHLNGVSSSVGHHPGVVGDPPSAGGLLPFPPNFDPDLPDSVPNLVLVQFPFQVFV